MRSNPEDVAVDGCRYAVGLDEIELRAVHV